LGISFTFPSKQQKNVKTISSSSTDYSTSNHTAFSQIQTDLTVPLMLQVTLSCFYLMDYCTVHTCCWTMHGPVCTFCTGTWIFLLIGCVLLLQNVHEYGKFPVRNPGLIDRDHLIVIISSLWMRPQVSNLSDTKLIRHQTFQKQNLTNTKLTRCLTYRIPDSSETEHVRYRTYQISNLSASVLIVL
jgi:hypothetical protein